MSKPKYSSEQKIKACTEYILGQKTFTQLSLELGMSKFGRSTIRGWVNIYQKSGAIAFEPKDNNPSYSKELKQKVVKEYLLRKSSIEALAIKYNISARVTIQRWIKRYNCHMELKDYDPKPEVYMANTLRTTYEERIEIVKYCLAHDRDIKGTAAKYGCNYAQLYQWIRKYESNGEETLIDKRGKRKNEDELTDLEKAEKKIAQLEREKEEYRKKYELLKKAEERERW